MGFLNKILINLKEKRKQKKIDRIVRDIKNIKIQGAKNVAKEALKAYKIKPTKDTKKKLIDARPTEPLLIKALENFDKEGYSQTRIHFKKSQRKINNEAIDLIEDNSVVFTHCHSSTVVNALINAKENGKKFEVYNTETRPLYQGRKTSKELSRAGIKVTTFTDDAARIAIKSLQGTKKADVVFFGSDAILKDGVINKIGSGMFASIAKENDIPVYILADSWKYCDNIELEKRDFEEVWKNKPKNVRIENPAFEKIPPKNIKRIVSEIGTYTLKTFIKRVKKKSKNK